MRSIERMFKRIAKDNPLFSTYLCFAYAVKGRGFSRDRVLRYFNKLVDPEDYDKRDKEKVLSFLYGLTEKHT